MQTEIDDDDESESESDEQYQTISKKEYTTRQDDPIFKIYLPNSTYKSVRVNVTDTADKVCEILAEKLGFPYSYSKYLVLYERVKDKGRSLLSYYFVL